MIEKLGALNGPKIFLKICKQFALIKNESVFQKKDSLVVNKIKRRIKQ